MSIYIYIHRYLYKCVYVHMVMIWLEAYTLASSKTAVAKIAMLFSSHDNIHFFFDNSFVSHYRIGDLGLVPAPGSPGSAFYHTRNLPESLVQKEVTVFLCFTSNH